MKSVVIIGGGIIGLCTAYYAAKRGHRVTILERAGAGHDCCSLGNAGMIVPSHFVPLAAPGMVAMGLRMMLDPESPFHIRPRLSWKLIDWMWKFLRACDAEKVKAAAPLLRDLSLASRRCFEELADLPGHDLGLVKKGLLMLCRSEDALAHEAKAVELAESLNLEAQLLSPQQAAALEPGMPMTIAGAAYFPQDCHLDPAKFFSTIAAQLTAMGVQIQYDSPVTSFDTAAGRILAVHTPRGLFTADEYVLAGGSWSSAIAEQLRLSLPLQAGKGYSLTLSDPPRRPNLCAILSEARVAVTPMGTALRIAGTMEITGLDLSVNADRVRGIIKSIPTYYPTLSPDHFETLPVWSGLRPCSPDGLPYLGRFRRFSNLSVATGHAMMGLSLAPITGKLMAEVLSDDAPSFDPRLLSPDRYN
jgi:D-amino-acid dehydrogenase